MKLELKVKKQIDEVKYLTTDNTWRYRAIIRYMYNCYERIKYECYKDEILENLKKYDEFKEYSDEYLKSDLDTLVKWNNLIATADTTRVKTVEEFKNREFKYQLSPYTVEIERMLLNIENMTVESHATLDRSLVEKFRSLLEKYEYIMLKDDKQVYEWWRSLNRSFKELNQNYQDYISQFYSPKTEELMKTTQFLIFKESFIKYLRDFIRGLQLNSIEIKNLLVKIKEEDINKIIEKVLSYEKTIPNIGSNIKDEEFIDVNKGRFHSIKEWFVSFNKKEPLVEQLINNTNDVITKITRFASQIADKMNNGANRKEEYRKIGELFSECSSIEEANKLSSLVFGVFSIHHVKFNGDRVTESINSSIFDEKPAEVITKPRVRGYKRKLIKNPIEDKSLRKEQRKKEILKQRKMEKELTERFIVNDEINFKNLPKITQKDRRILLRWLTKGRASKNKCGKTEFGRRYKVIEDEIKSYIKVECEDGVLTMPNYIIKFEKED